MRQYFTACLSALCYETGKHKIIEPGVPASGSKGKEKGEAFGIFIKSDKQQNLLEF